MKKLQEHTLVECLLHTGRTHQIRVHLEHLGFPILGDKIYGQKDDIFLEYLEHGATKRIQDKVCFSRHCLHSVKIMFNHPNGTNIEVEAPLPQDMSHVLNGGSIVWKY